MVPAAVKKASMKRHQRAAKRWSPPVLPVSSPAAFLSEAGRKTIQGKKPAIMTSR